MSFAREVSRGHDTKMDAAATELSRQGNRASGWSMEGSWERRARHPCRDRSGPYCREAFHLT